jgi:hypothetical protein
MLASEGPDNSALKFSKHRQRSCLSPEARSLPAAHRMPLDPSSLQLTLSLCLLSQDQASHGR